jgi:uncharacterized protein (TIRG00374 family)
LTSRFSKILNLIFLLLGAGLLVALLLGLDYAEVGARMVQVGWYFLASFATYVLSLVVTTAAWQQMIDPAHSRAAFRDLLVAFWAGHAINSVTPTGNLGEVYKGTALRGQVEGVELVASLISFNFMSSFSLQLFVALGPPLCLLLPEVPPRITWLLFVAALLAFVPTVVFYALLRMGVTGRLVKLLTRLPFVKIKEPEALLRKAMDVDRRIKESRRQQPWRFVRACFWFACARVLNALEVWVLLMPLLPGHGLVHLLLLALLTQTVSQLVAWVVTFIPSGIGVAEGSTALLYNLLGIGSVVGFSMELVRRARMILGVSIGLALAWVVRIRSSRTPGQDGPFAVDPASPRA